MGTGCSSGQRRIAHHPYDKLPLPQSEVQEDRHICWAATWTVKFITVGSSYNKAQKFVTMKFHFLISTEYCMKFCFLWKRCYHSLKSSEKFSTVKTKALDKSIWPATAKIQWKAMKRSCHFLWPNIFHFNATLTAWGEDFSYSNSAAY